MHWANALNWYKIKERKKKKEKSRHRAAFFVVSRKMPTFADITS
jgi:hypothetical protein